MTEGNAIIEIPWKDLGPHALVRRRLELRLDPPHGKALRRVFDSLQYDGAQTADGSFVKSQQDAVRWILERLAEEIEEG